ncbi:MAG: serine protease [Pirellulaceae bacterium]|nr:serine protease [Pirellulaceae bacterium]
MKRFLRWSSCLAVALCGAWAGAEEQAPAKVVRMYGPKELEKAVVGAGIEQVQRALTAIDRGLTFAPAANDEKTRGIAAELYPKIAPAVVVVRTVHGHGTGFIVDPEGWILTNHHVVDDGDIDAVTGTQTVKIYTGRIVDGLMQVNEQPLLARVHLANEEKDLAIVKLVEKPKTPLPTIAIAKGNLLPGSDCIVLGHPAAGMLWTIRSGEIASVGVWPRDTIDVSLARLALTGKDKEDLEKQLATAATRKVVVSSCGINPGDSGGPLVNKAGELVAVTFAIPKADPKSGISYDKISYHVHMDEVKMVLAEKPLTAPVYVPDVWPAALLSIFRDRDQDGRADTLLFGLDRNEPPTGVFYDLDQNSPSNIDPSKLDEPAERAKWDFEFAVQLTPKVRTFYDTDNDGKLDLILTDLQDDGVSDIDLRLVGGKWKLMPHSNTDPLRTVDASHFADKGQQARFARLVGGQKEGGQGQREGAGPAPAPNPNDRPRNKS